VAEPTGARGVSALSAGAGALHAVIGDDVWSGAPARRAPPRGVLAELPADPPIERIHRAALDYLGLGPARIEAMRRGVRRRGWLPQVDLAGGLSRDRDRGSDVDESIVSGALRQLVDRDEGSSRDRDVSLRFTWDLGDLAYHPEQIDISREAREVIELRDDVLDEITQLYFERRRVLVELAAAETPAEALRLRLRAAELAAGIDAWTGGWFSRVLHGSAP
jgi:outer membrane protein TolC